MFVKMYRYKIRKHYFQKWKKNNDTVRRLYKKYGGDSKRLIRKNGNFFHVIEFEHHQSKKEYLKIVKKFDDDRRASALFQEFLRTVYHKRFSEEEFETV